MSKPTTRISPAKRAANRRNARKSTGPRTPQGKARSARNALKHGLLAKTIILPNAPGDPNNNAAADPAESPQDFNALLESLLHDFAPQTTHHATPTKQPPVLTTPKKEKGDERKKGMSSITAESSKYGTSSFRRKPESRA